MWDVLACWASGAARGGEARLAEGCSVVEDSVHGSLRSCWTQPSAALGGKTWTKEITVLHQCPAPEEGLYRGLQAPKAEHFKALHKALALCVYISLERRFKASVIFPKETGNKSESFLSTDVRERGVANEKLSSERCWEETRWEFYDSSLSLHSGGWGDLVTLSAPSESMTWTFWFRLCYNVTVWKQWTNLSWTWAVS